MVLQPSMFLFLDDETAVVNVTAKTTYLSFTVSGITDQGHPHGFQHQHEPWTSARTLVVV